MARPILALVTDFGVRDHYVGAMKGVILGIAPEAAVVDITHEIAPQDILGGALELQAAAPYFPPGTVFVGVVDPGVGSGRRGIAVESAGRFFVGPDNGLFTAALEAAAPWRAVELTERRYARDEISRTFEGRDRFAPAAAWLARGEALSALGRPITTLVTLDIPRASVEAGVVRGVVLRADRFGNLITSIRRDDLAALATGATVRVGGAAISDLVGTYAEAATGALCALVGSSGRLEIAVNGGSAASVLRVDRGADVQVHARSGA